MYLLSQMKFDGTIDLGSIITLVGMLFTLYVFHLNNERKISRIEQRVELMWNVFKKRFHITEQEEKEERELFS